MYIGWYHVQIWVGSFVGWALAKTVTFKRGFNGIVSCHRVQPLLRACTMDQTFHHTLHARHRSWRRRPSVSRRFRWPIAMCSALCGGYLDNQFCDELLDGFCHVARLMVRSCPVYREFESTWHKVDKGKTPSPFDQLGTNQIISLSISYRHLHLGNIWRVLHIRVGVVDWATTHVAWRNQLNHLWHWHHVLLPARLYLSRLARSRPCRRSIAKFVTLIDAIYSIP